MTDIHMTYDPLTTLSLTDRRHNIVKKMLELFSLIVVTLQYLSENHHTYIKFNFQRDLFNVILIQSAIRSKKYQKYAK